MVDITEIAAVVAATGVITGVVYYILDIRHQAKIRNTDLIMRTQPMFSMSYKKWREYMLHIPMDHKDYDDFVKKYGSLMSGKPEPETVLMLLSYFDILGILVKRNLLRFDIVYDFYGMYATNLPRILMPLIEGLRKEWNVREFVNCEYLFNEMKKREQQLAKAQ